MKGQKIALSFYFLPVRIIEVVVVYDIHRFFYVKQIDSTFHISVLNKF